MTGRNSPIRGAPSADINGAGGGTRGSLPLILVWARETAGLTLQDAAARVGIRDARGVGPSTGLAALEHGDGEPTRPTLVRMAQHYRRPLCWPGVLLVEQKSAGHDRAPQEAGASRPRRNGDVAGVAAPAVPGHLPRSA